MAQNLKDNKRATLLDWIYVPVIIFIGCIVLVASLMLISKVKDSNLFAEDEASESAVDSSVSTLLIMDGMMLFVIIGLSLFVIISAYFSSTHPAFFFIGVFLLMIALTLCGILSNAYETFSSQGVIDTYSSQYPKILFLMSHLPLYIAFMGFATGIVMYIGYQKTQ